MITIKRYNSINEALAYLSLELAIDGTDVEVKNAVGDFVKTKELQDYHLSFVPNYNNIITLPERKFPVKGAQAEFLWYMTGVPNANAVAKFLPNWLKFGDEQGKVNSNYGAYWKVSIPRIIDILKRDKTSRRAVMNIYHDGNEPFGKDTPCTLTLQFLIRTDKYDGIDKLDLIVNMRSNDIWYGLSIDQYTNSMLHQLVLHSLQETYPDLQLGWYGHSSGSMHAYVSESSGNATLTVQQLAAVYQSFAVSNDQGRRHELPQNITFENFWQTVTDDDFKSELLEHFRQYV
jgi:thymidylate synthase